MTWLETWVLTEDQPAAPSHHPISPHCSPPLKASLHSATHLAQEEPMQLPRDVCQQKPQWVEKS